MKAFRWQIEEDCPMHRLSTLLTRVIFGSALLAVAGQAAAQADDYPSRRINIIVPYSAGGATDVLARQLADQMSKQMNATVTVENRPGAGATLGTAQAAKSKPDGYTLFLGQVSSHGIAPAVYKQLQYDAKKDFAPIVRLLSIPNVMVVDRESPAKSAKEFIELAKTKRVTFASSGVGSSIHLSGEMFKVMTGTEMTHVPFRGSGEAVPALISGDVDVMFDNLPSALPHIKSGELRALAVTTPERAEALPDVPTLAETGISGLEDFSATSWFALFAPAGTDPSIVSKLNQSLQKVLASEDFVKFAQSRGAKIDGGSPEDLSKFVDRELAAWKKTAETAGVTVE
jgi:tripartite-type tricarboxylate transporter receptor subunit TctC